MLLKQGVTDRYKGVKEYLYGRSTTPRPFKGSSVGHVANQAKILYFELGVTTSTLSKTKWGPTKTKVIYQCKVNNFHLNLTKNQYFITKLLAGIKKDWASQGGCAEEEVLGQLDVEDGMIHGSGGWGCGDNKEGSVVFSPLTLVATEGCIEVHLWCAQRKKWDRVFFFNHYPSKLPKIWKILTK